MSIPFNVNQWIRLVIAPVIGLGLTVWATVGHQWGPDIAAVIGVLIFSPLVTGQSPSQLSDEQIKYLIREQQKKEAVKEAAENEPVDRDD